MNNTIELSNTIDKSRTRYFWAPGSRHKVSAQVAGEVCDELSVDGKITPSDMVDASRPDDAPLHPEFEWDDSVAAERYRETQARAIIRHIITYVEMPDDDEKTVIRVVDRDAEPDDDVVVRKVRAFSSPHRGGGSALPYESTFDMLSSDEGRDVLISNAHRDMEAFIEKHWTLAQFSQGISNVIDAMNDELSS